MAKPRTLARTMSAKKSSPSSKTPAGATAQAPNPTSPAPASADVPAAASEASTPWIESSDPKRRKIGQIVLTGLWIYVAALWLLALDQWFNWGIFGPRIPPLP